MLIHNHLPYVMVLLTDSKNQFVDSLNGKWIWNYSDLSAKLNFFQTFISLSWPTYPQPNFIIIIINGGILSPAYSHHIHYWQIPTMVGFCHGGNLPASHDDHHHDHNHHDHHRLTRKLLSSTDEQTQLDQSQSGAKDYCCLQWSWWFGFEYWWFRFQILQLFQII